MRIPEQGRSEEEVFADLEARRGDDVDWRQGRTFGYVFVADDEAAAVAERAYTSFLWENALDPTAYPSLLQLETEVVAMAAAHLGGGPDVVGNFTSGGTESVLLAVKTARDWARANRPAITRPRMVVPVTAHACFHKAAQYFDVIADVIPVDPETCRADVDAMRAAITEDTILLVGSAASFAHGSVDPIPAIGRLALERDLLFHVDGCIGGFLLPYFRRLGGEVTDFDFTVPGVTSISMDLHKYAFCAKGASVVLYRDKELRQHQIFSWSGWTGYTIINPTIQSSKSGGPVAAAWAVMNHLGDAGYLEAARRLKEATDRIVEAVDAHPDVRILGRPEMSLLAIASETVDVFRLSDAMKARGWHMQPQFSTAGLPASIHLTVLPPTVESVEEWSRDLDACVEEVRGQGPDERTRELATLGAGLTIDALTPDAIEELLELAGIGGGRLPGDLADINHILDAVDPEVKDRLLVSYFNELSRHRDAPAPAAPAAGA